ncbi:MAG: molybdopterin-dependent oxidoreductase, partial [Alphaproteobacteria bacterium]|nr:molybdopterin-dependent oxidoreductase [Alphaproteobacteria bacterium]
SVEHARDGEVLIAYAMNGAPLPLLNGFPLRLVVPGWFATYWVKMLDSIEVLDRPDDNFWMAKAYLIPDTPRADIKPGAHGVKQVPIGRMLPRSFITNLAPGSRVGVGAPQLARGVAFGGDAGVARVEFSTDGGMTWQAAELGADEGTYGFRRWQGHFTPAAAGEVRLAVRCTNTSGEGQPATPNWNPGGYMRNVIETVTVTAA